jgi:hypothetical protein
MRRETPARRCLHLLLAVQGPHHARFPEGVCGKRPDHGRGNGSRGPQAAEGEAGQFWCFRWDDAACGNCAAAVAKTSALAAGASNRTVALSSSAAHAPAATLRNTQMRNTVPKAGEEACRAGADTGSDLGLQRQMDRDAPVEHITFAIAQCGGGLAFAVGVCMYASRRNPGLAQDL